MMVPIYMRVSRVKKTWNPIIFVEITLQVLKMIKVIISINPIKNWNFVVGRIDDIIRVVDFSDLETVPPKYVEEPVDV